jgi:hypothetical protein
MQQQSFIFNGYSGKYGDIAKYIYKEADTEGLSEALSLSTLIQA